MNLWISLKLFFIFFLVTPIIPVFASPDWLITDYSRSFHDLNIQSGQWFRTPIYKILGATMAHHEHVVLKIENGNFACLQKWGDGIVELRNFRTGDAAKCRSYSCISNARCGDYNCNGNPIFDISDRNLTIGDLIANIEREENGDYNLVFNNCQDLRQRQVPFLLSRGCTWRDGEVGCEEDVPPTCGRVLETYQGSDLEYVESCYNEFLNRGSDPLGREHWVGQVRETGRDTVRDCIKSSTEAFVHRVYRKYLNRWAETGGLAHWSRVVAEQGRDRVRCLIHDSEEARNLHRPCAPRRN